MSNLVLIYPSYTISIAWVNQYVNYGLRLPWCYSFTSLNSQGINDKASRHKAKTPLNGVKVLCFPRRNLTLPHLTPSGIGNSNYHSDLLHSPHYIKLMLDSTIIYTPIVVAIAMFYSNYRRILTVGLSTWPFCRLMMKWHSYPQVGDSL